MWLGRRLRSARAWAERQSLSVQICVNFALLSALSLAIFGVLWGGIRGFELYRYWFDFTPEDRAYWRKEHAGYANHGLPSVGRRLKAEMEAVPDPETTLWQHPDWAVERFKNGEWIVWHSISSMNLRVGAGTAVVKDSRGRVRIYFGFVKFDNEPLAGDASTLKEFDERLELHWSLREWVPEQ